MSQLNLIRFWKDEDYRERLSDPERVLLPENPAGVIDLEDSELDPVVGANTERLLTIGCCSGLTTDPGLCTFFTCIFTMPGCGGGGANLGGD